MGFRANRLEERFIELVCPHRRGRVRPRTQDGRALRRYKHRWIVERTFAWLGWQRRLLVRHERLVHTYRAFMHIALAIITFNHL